MNKREFIELLDKDLEGKVSDEESQLLINYYNSFQQNKEWNEAELGSSQELESSILHQLKNVISQRASTLIVPFYNRTWFRVAAAAIIIFMFSSTVWLIINKEVEQPVAKVKEIKPALQKISSSNTTLALADGRIITLDSVANGVLAHEGLADIKKEDGKLVYELSGPSLDGKQSTLHYNIVSTPKGGQYQVVLPDGSKVWLNAASTLRFPTAFTAKERRVEIIGEAYFEVAKDANKPFRVYVSALANKDQQGALVEVLGTHFNINAYDDENVMKTTLLEGSVKVTPVNDAQLTIHSSRILLPGQQAQIGAYPLKRGDIKVQTVDVGEVVAWKNNLFNFNTADIKTIMRQISRWYDVEIVYEGKMPVRNFSGKINRNTGLSTVLKILEQSNIRFHVKGKKITVKSPKSRTL